jgi:phospholipid/cholesterol/gamma-HCH transport system ATP-binding protein
MAPLMQVQDLAIGAGGRLLHQGLTFDISRGEVLAVVGPSGCGKSTLLRHLVGLDRPLAGHVRLAGQDLHEGDEDTQAALRRRFGVMFQSGALWSSMSLGDNLMLPMRLFTPWSRAECRDRARFKLALVGLADAFDRLPAQLSGGMRKRAALARALALDPELLFLDEPGSGLDPLNTARLDELVQHLQQDLQTAVVMVTHDVASVRAVAGRVLYLDDQPGTPPLLGHLADLLQRGPADVQAFFQRGHAAAAP